jgi:hypothetical protein
VKSEIYRETGIKNNNMSEAKRRKTRTFLTRIE